MDSRRVNLAVVSGALQRQTTLYEWIWGIEVRPNEPAFHGHSPGYGKG
jgi:hypothetical protein